MEGFSLRPASAWEAMASLSGCLSRAADELRRFDEGALPRGQLLGTSQRAGEGARVRFLSTK